MTESKAAVAPAGTAPKHRNLGLALIVIAAAQLMVVLDATIVNIALPSIAHQFHIGGSTLAWIPDAYALSFGGLLLLGGRAGDLYGRRRVFRIGLVIFAGVSLLGGLAPNEQLLIAARLVQGIGGAIIAPAALSLIATTFAEGPDRSRAMGVYAAMAGVGATVGLLLGGVLTDYLSWRWVFFVNVPIGIAVLLGSTVLAEGDRQAGRLDVPGAITGTGGLVVLVYGIIRAGEDGWGNALTLASFAVAVVLLAAFAILQTKTTHPMLPLRLLRNRNRSGAYATMLLLASGMFATFYFLTLYLQQILRYSPARAGLAYLPFTAGMMISAAVVVPRLIGRIPPRYFVLTGAILGAGGMFWFSRLTPASSYWGELMPAMLITALGLGAAFLPLTLGAVAGTTQRDAGIASALLNAGQQVGGALGLAMLATIAATASSSRLPNAASAFYRGLATRDFALVRQAADALTHGYTAAFAVSVIILLAAGVVAFAAINTRGPAPSPPHRQGASATPVPSHGGPQHPGSADQAPPTAAPDSEPQPG